MSDKCKYLLFGGKGGVGKTTMAAAAALKIAREGYKVLVISTDPAHSTADSFDKKIGDEPTKIEKNLYAVEISTKKATKNFQNRLSGPDVQKEMSKEVADMMAMFEEQFADSSSAPGMDEMAAFNEFLELMEGSEYDYIVFDTAPTGHTLRFLSLPEVLNSWIGKMLKMKMQMSRVKNFFKKILPFAQPDDTDYGAALKGLEDLKKRIVVAREILTDPEVSAFNLVLIPEEMAIFESIRACDELEAMDLPVTRAIVNKIQPESVDCIFCKERYQNQQKNLKKIREEFIDQKIIEIPLMKKEIRGIKDLEKILSYFDSILLEE